MGTNYYFYKKRAREHSYHIGKSSAGWCFSLHVYPEHGINTLADWKLKFALPNYVIKDEYGKKISAQEMISIITVRSGTFDKSGPFPSDNIFFNNCSGWGDYLRRNNAVLGPNKLMRHKIAEGICVGHGEGTWDYLIGDFS